MIVIVTTMLDMKFESSSALPWWSGKYKPSLEQSVLSMLPEVIV